MKAGSAGFTLLEILVVLVILALGFAVVAGAVPRRSTGLDLSTQTDALAGALRAARAQAMAEDRPVVFAALPDGQGWRLDAAVHVLPSGLRLSVAGGPALLFEPDGSASGGVITLAVRGRAAALRVDWLTGRVLAASPAR